MGTETLGHMLTNFIRNSILISTELMSDWWADSWITVCMGASLVYGPPIDLYLARLGKGCTAQQFLLMNVFVPPMFVYFRINTFDSLAIYYQWKNLVDIWSFVQAQGSESIVIGILQRLPLSMALIVFFVIATMISLVTLVDPMTFVLATIPTKGISAEEEVPEFLKAFWDDNMDGVVLAVITLCGISALRGMFVLGGVLMMLLTIIPCWYIVKEGQNTLARNKREGTL